MLIPLGTDRAVRRPSLITPALIAACVAAFAAQAALDGDGPVPAFTSRFWVEGGGSINPLTLVTYAFLHGDLLHLAGNMLFLWVFGRAIEDRLGRVAFLAFYLGGGAFAGLVHALFEAAPAVGASGAVSAVTGAFLVLFPRTRIKVLWFFILISFMMAPAWFFIGLQIAWNLLAQVSGKADGVAVLAHLAGYSFGFAVAFVLLWARVLPREPYDLFSITRQAKRRREFKSLTSPMASTAPRPGTMPKSAGRPATRADAAHREALAAARAEVSREISAGRPDHAVAPYRALLDRFGTDPAAVTLARNGQYHLALHLCGVGDHGLASRALADFVRAYPTDPETPQIKILLGRTLAEVGEVDRARAVLVEAKESLGDEELAALADAELDQLARRGA